jgi:hypothetical protein
VPKENRHEDDVLLPHDESDAHYRCRHYARTRGAMNRLIPVSEVAQQIADDINAIAAEHGIPAIDLARLFGASIGAPVDVSDLLEDEDA